MNKRLPFIISSTILALLLATLCTYQVEQQHAVMLSSMGKPSLIDKPGLHFRMPWPLQKVQHIDLRGQSLIGEDREFPSRDNIVLIARVESTWKIEDALLFHTSLGNQAEARTQLKTLLDDRMDTVLRNYNYQQFFGPGQLDNIGLRLQKELNEKSVEQYGIRFQSADITSLKVPPENSTAIITRMRESIGRDAAIIRSKAETAAQKVRTEAETASAKLIAAAIAEARKKKGMAITSMTDKLSKGEANIDFILFLRKLEAMRESGGAEDTIIVDPNHPVYELMHKSKTKQKTAIKEAP